MENPKCIVVDDDPHVRDLTTAILQSLGLDVTTASCGLEALSLLEEPATADGVSAIFLDVMMPDIDGLEVLRVLKGRAHTKDIPIIMLTAKDKGDDIISGYQIGADYYIPKPFNREQIVFGLDLVLSPQDEG